MLRGNLTDVNNAFSFSPYPDNNPPFGWAEGARSRYDVVAPGTHNSTNPAIFVVDSGHRLRDRYPRPDNYTIQLPDYKDVVSVELTHAQIPNSGYLINSNYNTLHFSEDPDGDNIVEATIPNGDWTAQELTTNLETAMNNASPNGRTYEVTVDDNTSRFHIEEMGGNDFNLHFEGITRKAGPHTFHQSRYVGDTKTSYRESSVGSVIGFPPEDFFGEHEYIAPNNFNLNINKYIILHIKGLERVDSQGNDVQDAFATIPLNCKNKSFSLDKSTNSVDNVRYIKYFQQPLPSLDSLQIKFLDSFGHPYDFNGIDHSMIFEIHSLTRTSQYVHDRAGIRAGTSFEEYQLATLKEIRDQLVSLNRK